MVGICQMLQLQVQRVFFSPERVFLLLKFFAHGGNLLLCQIYFFGIFSAQCCQLRVLRNFPTQSPELLFQRGQVRNQSLVQCLDLHRNRFVRFGANNKMTVIRIAEIHGENMPVIKFRYLFSAAAQIWVDSGGQINMDQSFPKLQISVRKGGDRIFRLLQISEGFRQLGQTVLDMLDEIGVIVKSIAKECIIQPFFRFGHLCGIKGRADHKQTGVNPLQFG